MWILVIGREGLEEREDSAVACLHELGCDVQTANLWDRLDTEELVANPPTVVLIEAGDEGDAGRAALVRVRSAEPLHEVPVLIGVTTNAITRLDTGDGFDDFIIGALTNDAGGVNAGRAYLYQGGLGVDSFADLRVEALNAGLELDSSGWELRELFD